MSRHNIANTTGHGRSLRLAALALAIAAFAATGGSALASDPGDLPSRVQLQQWETKPDGGWITGALNNINSDYFEGEVVPFRLEIPANVDAGVYQFSVCRNYENGTRRGYLFHAPFDTDRPAVPGGSISSTQDGFAAVSATLDSVTDVGGRGACNAGDREATVVITKNEGAAYILWGGHLAAPDDAGVGPGNSAAYWPGASLHMKVLTPSKDVAIQTCFGPETATPSFSATSTKTATVTATATWTATTTGTITVTATVTTPTPSSTPTPTATPTGTPTDSATPTATPTSTATATGTATSTPTGTATPPTATATESPARSPRPGATRTPTAAPATATPPAGSATPTLISEQAGASTQPRLLPATGMCGDSSDGGSLWISLLLGGVAAVTAAGGGAFWLLRHAHAAVR